jgi:hypothetical protein
VLRLALAPELQRIGGCYFEGVHIAHPDPQAADETARRRLWELSEDLASRALDGQPGAW